MTKIIAPIAAGMEVTNFIAPSERQVGEKSSDYLVRVIHHFEEWLDSCVTINITMGELRPMDSDQEAAAPKRRKPGNTK